jgi:hypothetical protein
VVFHEGEDPVTAVFAVRTSEEQRDFYLEVLVDLAEIAQDSDFLKSWHDARDSAELRDLLIQFHNSAVGRRAPDGDTTDRA